MTEQWQELKETIIEMRDNDGTGTQQEICKFLVNYMDVLEKQIQEPKTIQEKQAESEKYQKAFDDGYENGYAQARFDYEQESITDRIEYGTDGNLYKLTISNGKEFKQEPKTEKVIKMRRPTPEERESVEKYVKSISKPTGVNFWTLSQESCNNVISREEALQALCKAVHKNDNTIPCPNQRISCLWNKTKVQDYAEEILKLQPIKLQQKIGYWVRHNTSSNMYYYDCSLCGCVAPCTETADSYLWKLSNYCPDCGARMESAQNE